MKRFTCILILLFTTTAMLAQKSDSLYITPYPQKMALSPFIATNMLIIGSGEREFNPNSPVKAGLGFSIKNTVVNFRLSTSIAPLEGSEYGKTKATDFQLHNYGRKFIFDLFIQRYKGFYEEDDSGTLTLYPDVLVSQIGAEGTYVFNGNKFSSKAAFQQGERQLQSAGSFLLGGGMYVYELRPDGQETIDNIQFGAHGGYGYSWVVGERWLLSAMGTLGVNVGNDPEALTKIKLKLYPSVFARWGASYNKPGWSVNFSTLVQNKVLYAAQSDAFTITSFGAEIVYIYRFDSFRK